MTHVDQSKHSLVWISQIQVCMCHSAANHPDEMIAVIKLHQSSWNRCFPIFFKVCFAFTSKAMGITWVVWYQTFGGIFLRCVGYSSHFCKVTCIGLRKHKTSMLSIAALALFWGIEKNTGTNANLGKCFVAFSFVVCKPSVFKSACWFPHSYTDEPRRLSLIFFALWGFILDTCNVENWRRKAFDFAWLASNGVIAGETFAYTGSAAKERGCNTAILGRWLPAGHLFAASRQKQRRSRRWSTAWLPSIKGYQGHYH